MNNNLEILLNSQHFKKLYDKKCHQISEKYGLTKLEIEILLFFENNKQYDTAKDIVDFKFFTKSHVSKAVASLINNGYMIGKPDELDRRCIHLEISDDAKQVIKEANEMRKDLIGILYTGISLEEKKIMADVAKKIDNNIKVAIENDE